MKVPSERIKETVSQEAYSLLPLQEHSTTFAPSPVTLELIPLISLDNLPLEWEYVDDADFVDEDPLILEQLYFPSVRRFFMNGT